MSAFLPFPDGALFDAGWLSALSDEVPRAEVLDRARPVLADAIARTDAAGTAALACIDALVAGAALDAIPALLAAETVELPDAAAASERSIHDLMSRVAYKRRELMPLFPDLIERVAAVHAAAIRACGNARWQLMAARARMQPGRPSSPIQGAGTRYVKSDRFDARAAESLPSIDRTRADRILKRLGEAPVPDELELCPLDDGGDLWTIKAGGISRFILRVERDRRGPFYMVEDVGPQAA
ncbi:hypothetical protein J2848_000103 [Azospirillum lipoferum]|uniref:Uncharacterized protein n=1 Tax=Azospirillum lipoferum TaxID=193 RepID=A0A5A9GUC9_AZOLI|nr:MULTISPECIES: hypothetical protein [Azospirillum]KAA0596989.1 hypothetical protein FZ942_07685 [Azospirillum lipoferum]MCP1608467.1 hypothetical protein [Azospirillum lipoferum]MDW5536212.1 hypothetical protein [Azospirillum sp. NL1]